jgi:uncharacterized protein (TIGR02246 family)
MQLRSLLIIFVFAVLFASACENAPTNASAVNAKNTSSADTSSKPDPKVVDEIKDLLARHDKALNDKNVEDVLKTFATDANTVVLGTGSGERFVGPEAIKEAYTEMFKDYDAGTLTVTCDWKTGGADPDGTMAWLAATCPATDSFKGAKREYALNVSAAAVKGADGWHFAMLHMSNSNDPGPPPGGKETPAGSKKGEPAANSTEKK